jgi:uncharacterized protein with beta-barrel porin domain
VEAEGSQRHAHFRWFRSRGEITTTYHQPGGKLAQERTATILNQLSRTVDTSAAALPMNRVAQTCGVRIHRLRDGVELVGLSGSHYAQGADGAELTATSARFPFKYAPGPVR